MLSLDIKFTYTNSLPSEETKRLVGGLAFKQDPFSKKGNLDTETSLESTEIEHIGVRQSTFDVDDSERKKLLFTDQFLQKFFS